MTGHDGRPAAGLRPAWRPALRSACFLLPAAFALWWGLRLAVAAWSVGGFGPGGGQDFDPLVAILRGGSADSGVGVTAAQLERADRLAVNDPRYVFRLGLWWSREAGETGAGGPSAAPIRDAFAEAARRAPTDGVLRYYLAEASRRLGLLEDGDAEARAALRLAPLNAAVKSRVARYLLERSEGGSGGDLLGPTLRSLEGDLAGAVEFLRARADLPDEDLAAIVERSEIVPAFALDLLGRCGRWEAALSLARKWEREGVVLSGEEGRTRLARAASRLAAGDAAGGLEDAEAARAALGAAFRGGTVLAEARLRTGDVRGGLAALGEALAAGAPVAEAARLSALETVPAGDAVEFWRRRALGGLPAMRLELARALFRSRRDEEGQEVARALLEVPETAGEANYLLALSFVRAGSRPIARRYAEEAAAIDPRNEAYRSLLEEVTR